eukprot:CAMPEP_0114431156 /NCGR_PEP_ID=MMETSP0103-20121206/10446_1 /TAXON_ID=37642 ORGANISM="Paraphysomonas imperforata, Strain PA2" /NCGR_SAMPLE_ID=MMETSP0103 /ASSEMBLY_ACC=CAM_ASM_000201 /LENGTH=430 /DNA_ID=CAMNT_0001600695 /DNA_START=96 /DNA_END=1386 /DNA_ORIENTATION=+
MCMYLEAGAIPALLLQISESFSMPSGKQGMLGGVVISVLGMGSPAAAYLLKNFDHKTVISYAIGFNNICTLFRALTPVGAWYSSGMFIGIRFLMGLMQCVLCVYLPLWVHEFAPSTQRAKWMGALQSSVPFGVMIGYIIAAVLVGPVASTDVCFHMLCWRWPLLFEWALLLPFCFAIHFVPRRHFAVNVHKIASSSSSSVPSDNASPILASSTYSTFPIPSPIEFKKIDFSTKAKSFTTVEMKCIGRPEHCETEDDGFEESESRQLSRRYSWHNEEPASSSLLCASLFTAMSPRPSNPKIDIGQVADDGSDDENLLLLTGAHDTRVDGGLARTADEMDAEMFAHLFPHSVETEGTICTGLRPVLVLLRIPLYMSLLCALAGLYFVVTGVQFWSTSYMILLFGDDYRPIVNTMFIFCAATAPTGGVLVGSW